MIHFAHPGARETACGISFQSGGELIHSAHKLAVNCDECQKTQAFGLARQHIPQIPTGQYRG